MSGPHQDDSLASHFEAATLELAAADKALTEAADFVRAQAPPPSSVGIQRATDDPHVLLRFGRFRARLHAAQGLLARAGRLALTAGTSEALVLVSLIEARAFSNDLVTELLGFKAGTSQWNYHHVGNHYLTGAAPHATAAPVAAPPPPSQHEH
jgi:hypothetical protein